MANRKVRWGIIGTAEIATKVVAGMHDAENAEVAAVASRSLDRAQAWPATRSKSCQARNSDKLWVIAS
jgi:predicted dehydrogenase